MCGIFGYLGEGKDLVQKEKVLNALKHRGPDDEGTFEDSNILLLHVRLSILDLSSLGHQPMVSPDGNCVLIYNGEIYNHNEIRYKLIKDFNIKFNSTSDTETLLYAFIHYGIGIVEKLNGIFAFAIYFKRENRIYLVRDHFGIKPLYFYNKGNTLAFSSEIKVMKDLKGLDKSLDYQALLNYLSYLWCPGEKTPFKYIKKLLPGHYLNIDLNKSISDQNIIPRQYYQIPFTGNYEYNEEKKAVNKLDELLHISLERQLLSDVPVGFFLSGGLDSSLNIAIVKDLFPNKKWECFTIDDGSRDLISKEGFANDLYFAIKVAKSLNQNLNFVPGDTSIIGQIDLIPWYLDEPQADLAPLHVLNISKVARSMGIKVLIGGTGGDDIFSGYRRHRAIKIDKYISMFPPFIFQAAKSWAAMGGFTNPFRRRMIKYLDAWDSDAKVRMINYFNWMNYEECMKLFSKDIQSELLGYDPQYYFKELLFQIPDEHNSLNQMLYLEMKTFLPDHNLNYTDKMSMTVAVEARVPYLDVDLVDFSCKLHPNLKIKNRTTKYLLKKVAERYLPKDLIYRSKSGFGSPVREWIHNDFINVINTRLSNENIIRQDIFNVDRIKKLIDMNNSGKGDYGYNILSLLIIDSWIKQFV
jgi:asparagine synthase (glutamine-hydrolysing)